MDSDASARDFKPHIRTLKQKQARKTALNLYDLSEWTENNKKKVKEIILHVTLTADTDPWVGKEKVNTGNFCPKYDWCLAVGLVQFFLF